MKYKKRKQYLEQKIQWWEKQSKTFQAATTRPGSIKTK